MSAGAAREGRGCESEYRYTRGRGGAQPSGAGAVPTAGLAAQRESRPRAEPELHLADRVRHRRVHAEHARAEGERGEARAPRARPPRTASSRPLVRWRAQARSAAGASVSRGALPAGWARSRARSGKAASSSSSTKGLKKRRSETLREHGVAPLLEAEDELRADRGSPRGTASRSSSSRRDSCRGARAASRPWTHGLQHAPQDLRARHRGDQRDRRREAADRGRAAARARSRPRPRRAPPPLPSARPARPPGSDRRAPAEYREDVQGAPSGEPRGAVGGELRGVEEEEVQGAQLVARRRGPAPITSRRAPLRPPERPRRKARRRRCEPRTASAAAAR